MLPLRDMNPTRRLPILTYGLIAVNVIVFVMQLGLSESQLQNVFLTQSVIPANIAAHPFALETILERDPQHVFSRRLGSHPRQYALSVALRR